MLIRTQNGINYTESFDGRRTWTTPADYWIPSPSALMYLGKFPSGNFFLIHHYQFEKRDHMSVLLSHDEGRSYDHVLLLDERFPVAYPVVFLDGDKVYAVYDRARYGYKEIHMAVFREENVLAGRCVTEGAGLKRVGPRQAVHSALRKSGRIVSGRGNTAHQWIPAAMGLHRKRAIFQIRKRRRIYRIPSNTRWPRCFAALCIFPLAVCGDINDKKTGADTTVAGTESQFLRQLLTRLRSATPTLRRPVSTREGSSASWNARWFWEPTSIMKPLPKRRLVMSSMTRSISGTA